MEPLTQFAVALAAVLQSAFPSITLNGGSTAVTAAWEPQPDVAMEDAALDTPAIWTIGMAETLAAEKGCGTEEFSLLVILQCKIQPADPKTQISALGLLASQIARTCRPLDPEEAFILNTSYADAICTKVVRNPATNLKELREGLFYSEILTAWKIC